MDGEDDDDGDDDENGQSSLFTQFMLTNNKMLIQHTSLRGHLFPGKISERVISSLQGMMADGKHIYTDT